MDIGETTTKYALQWYDVPNDEWIDMHIVEDALDYREVKSAYEPEAQARMRLVAYETTLRWVTA